MCASLFSPKEGECKVLRVAPLHSTRVAEVVVVMSVQ